MEKCVFDSGGDNLAVGELHGEVKIWDPRSGRLKQRFSPGAAYTGGVRCLAWSSSEPAPQKHRRRKDRDLALAVGVGSEVVLWNVTKGEKERVLSSAHSDVVNCVAWGRGNKLLYSGSSDHHVVEWDPWNGTYSNKWRADKHSVQSVCCNHDNTLLLTGGRSIKLWCLKDYSLVKKFAGHSAAVTQLVFITESMFLSLAETDRVVNLWDADLDSRVGTARASLACEEEVQSLDYTFAEEESMVQVALLSQNGVLHLFSFQSSVSVSAPLSSHCSMQFVSEASEGSTPSHLPIFAMYVSPEGVCVAHSNILRPTMEIVDFQQSERRVCFIRKSSRGLLLRNDVATPLVPSVSQKPVTVLSHGNTTLPSHPSAIPSKDAGITGVPMNDRLPGAMDVDIKLLKQLDFKRPTPDTLSQLLIQAVQCDDLRLLQQVVYHHNDRIARPSVRRLPITSVIPLLKMLISMLHANPTQAVEISSWLKAVLICHTAYLTTVPHLLNSISGLYQILDTRVNMFSKLCHLQGKLELILAQVEQSATGDEAVPVALMSVTAGDEGFSSEAEEDKWSSGDSETYQMDADSPVQSDSEEVNGTDR